MDYLTLHPPRLYALPFFRSLLMPWDSNLLSEQRKAAAHSGSHARLLAGPGTGKTLTLTRHICFLVTEKSVSPDSILAITFTRAAARELRQRVTIELGEDKSPRISTLHSFALRQLLKNSTIITNLPQPLRIADDWEERNVVLEDLKALCTLPYIRNARELLNSLSADWQSLTADAADWDKRFPDPAFLGAWREHRQTYGYTLRAELVYQLKKALEQRGDFELESPIEHLLVDEYQDLNRCDLAIVKAIASRGTELFIAGDDDQSIYGFRKADPEGIRRFPTDYFGATELELEICKRCDSNILEMALFVARQDPQRIEKTIRPEQDSGTGEFEILRFDDQLAEAKGIAEISTWLLEHRRLKPSDILILLRSDNKGMFSSIIRKQLEETAIPVATATDSMNPLDEADGRALLAFLQLATHPDDSLAWRTLLKTWCRGVGDGAIGSLYTVARNRGEWFAKTVLAAHADDSILPSNHRSRLSSAIGRVMNRLEALFREDTHGSYETSEELMGMISHSAESIVADDGKCEAILLRLARAVEAFGASSIETLVQAIGVASEDIEQELDEGKVNILTMHRAKGLTAEAVIIAATEDQYIPGRANGKEVEDERRLLYVSLTRAKHHLFITYCDRRTGQQQHTGRDNGTAARSLSQFLIDCPHAPQSGEGFIRSLGTRGSP